MAGDGGSVLLWILAAAWAIANSQPPPSQANVLRERVLLDVLEFETTRREFQGNQEMARRSQLRLDVLELNYRFTPDVTTYQYLGELNTTDGIYLNMFRQWAQMRTQLTQIKIVVLGTEEF